MVQPRAGREEPAPPGDGNSNHIIRIDEVGGRGIKIELREYSAENADLPPVTPIPISNETEVLTEPN